jgi:hypothetical protein
MISEKEFTEFRTLSPDVPLNIVTLLFSGSNE